MHNIKMIENSCIFSLSSQHTTLFLYVGKIFQTRLDFIKNERKQHHFYIFVWSDSMK